MKLRACALASTLLFTFSSGHAATFTPCDDADTVPALAGSRCAIEQVPADPSGAAGTKGDVALFVRMFPAAGVRRGSVWLIAGGPGESGASFYGLLPRLRDTFPGFDLVIPDDLADSRLPTADELEQIQRLDPRGLRLQEVPEP